ncbi:hypothetical protein BUE80_DR010891 [Diplocarpon rosae]|nr:hypothetical protein BUE80_DR010891 [Diplocarpon rosae]
MSGPTGDFGLIGLAVMGQNLILNAADHGFNVIAFNRTISKVDHFLANEAKVDDFIETLLPFVEKGDIIIDGGNSHFPDTNRRTKYLAAKGIRFMVHNGIEYGDMQLICEAYDIMKRALGLSDKEIGDVFAKWNKGVLDSFLIEITRDIMYFNDDDGTPLLEKILDSAGQKGTGKWTAINALDLGQPVTLIAEAVLARCLSSIKDQRVKASKTLKPVGTQTK